MVTPLLDRNDWSTITEHWTREEWLTYFYPVARAHVIHAKGAWVAATPYLEMDELISVGSMGLITAFDKWPAYAARTGSDPESRVSFWGFAKKRINFDLIDFQRRLLGRSPGARAAHDAMSIDDNPDQTAGSEVPWVAKPLDRSLQLELCATITQLTLPQQTVIALHYSEGLSRPVIAKLMGLDLIGLRVLHDTATAHLLAAAHHAVGIDTATPPSTEQPTPSLDGLAVWLADHDYPSVESYLASALDAYLEDAGILVSVFAATHKIAAMHTAAQS